MADAKHKTVVRVAGKEYTLISEDDPVYLRRVAAYVDRSMAELSQTTRLPSAQLAVLTAVNAVDDMMKSRDEIRRLRAEVDQLRAELEKRTHEQQA